MSRFMLLAGFACFVVTSIAACTPPCRALSEKVCACELNSREEQRCLEQLNAEANNRSPNAAEDQRCEPLLDTCTCEALEREDFAACGLSLPNAEADVIE